MTLTVIELPQGHGHPSDYIGLTLDAMIARLRQWDAELRREVSPVCRDASAHVGAI